MKRFQPGIPRMIAVTCFVAALAAGCGADPRDGAVASAASGSNEPTPTTVSPTLAPAERTPIDGQYTMTLTRQDVLAAGLRGSTAGEIAGDWRVTFSLGYAQQFVDVGGGGITADGYQGGFTVDGHRLTLTDQQAPLVFEWHLVGKRLTLDPVDNPNADPVDDVIWTAHPWERIGA
jgi:hypothetical protein